MSYVEVFNRLPFPIEFQSEGMPIILQAHEKTKMADRDARCAFKKGLVICPRPVSMEDVELTSRGLNVTSSGEVAPLIRGIAVNVRGLPPEEFFQQNPPLEEKDLPEGYILHRKRQRAPFPADDTPQPRRRMDNNANLVPGGKVG